MEINFIDKMTLAVKKQILLSDRDRGTLIELVLPCVPLILIEIESSLTNP